MHSHVLLAVFFSIHFHVLSYLFLCLDGWLWCSAVKDSSVLASTSSLTTKDDHSKAPTSVSATVAPVLTSTEGSGLESHDSKSLPHLQSEEVHPLVGRATHIQTATQPETVTPFITTQQHNQQGHGMGGGGTGGGGRGKKMEQLPEGLSIQTPLGVGVKQQSKLSEGFPYAMTTPANLQGHTSSTCCIMYGLFKGFGCCAESTCRTP